MSDKKAMTLRLSPRQAADIEGIARVDGTSVSDAVRDAIDARIEQRRADKDFQARLRRIIDEDRTILERLAR